jgi:hypothetical protein
LILNIFNCRISDTDEKKEGDVSMSQKSATHGNTAVKDEDSATRVTSARSFYRNIQPAKAQQISLVKADSAELSSKEHEACCRATD